ncbi:DUF3427 domain-containing protein [Fundicoccus culcitae]|uniref:DEAD/DEAH box helicase n=1 Tax=Fundicoccus culcitae TaxID=2969821 RepID=A0ABY5P469_9LACT|nr:DEAD/DEAH box helicase [Fundicoccus culcitae]UUX33533.1 DEAD/DEAH box helicase [Fundicoccus culcitae]
MYTLVNNTTKLNLLDVITQSIEECHRFYFNVAFVSYSGVQLLLDSLQIAKEKGIPGKLITGTYLNYTDPKAVRKLMDFDNLDVRIFQATETQGFHPKAYIFEYDTYYKVIIGSSNLTNYALKSNIEWNLQVIAKESDEKNDFLSYLKESFNNIWDQCESDTHEFLLDYEKFYTEVHKGDMIEDPPSRQIYTFPLQTRLKPNSMQLKAVDALEALRENGAERALAVAATGTGKTYMAAFDVKRVAPNKMLFIVHRDVILTKAIESFTRILNISSEEISLFNGVNEYRNATYVFSTNIMMSNHYKKFDPYEFDYIIIDEAHHATSSTYQKIINYFKPQFLLGMTATPERPDEGNVFDVFDNNLAIDVRLREALSEGLLVPFHYYGITDQSEIDLSDEYLSPEQIAEKLNITSRVDFIIDRMNFYGFDGKKLKSIGFCVTKKHAEFMATEFNKRGIPAVYLTDKSSRKERLKQIKLLEDDNQPLNIIFTVGLFNEGVDIPSVNQILMLRPTESPIIFTQQLGRGLRKHYSKGFLTILDFIGNYSKSFLIAIALYGSRSVNKKEIKHAVKHDFRSIPGPSNIRMDKIAKEQILNQLENENFYSLKYLKEDYSTFKSAFNGRIPWYLQNYLLLEGAPDPVLFFSESISANKSDNYYQFLSKVEKNNSQILKIISDKDFMTIYSTYSGFLPVKRPHDLAILELALTTNSFTLEVALKNVEKYVEGDQLDSTLHALEMFELRYPNHNKKYNFITLTKGNDDTYLFNEQLTKIIKNPTYHTILSDLIHYGLLRYQLEQGKTNYGTPFLKLYSEYSLQDLTYVLNFRKPFRALTGKGVTLFDKDSKSYCLIINLHKEEEISERIKYKDKFINQEHFQWESPNSASPETPLGKKLIYNLDYGVTLHLFVRKYSTINNVTQRYTYIGTADAISHRNEKPIEIQLALHNKMPIDLYQEFEPEKAEF